MKACPIERCIVSMAVLVCADEADAWRWYRLDPLTVLGGSTACELVRAGRGLDVVSFLFRVLQHEMPAFHLSTAPARGNEVGR